MILLATWNDGVFVIDDGEDEETSKHLFEQRQVRGLAIDRRTVVAGGILGVGT